MKITIVRFQLEPKEEPTCYGVGFEIICNNGRTFYRDIQVNLKEAEGKDDEYICQIAYAKLKDEIVNQTSFLENKSQLLNSEFVPDDTIQSEIISTILKP